MRAVFLVLAFALAAAGLRYQTDHCHIDCLHNERPSDTDGHEKQHHQCNCLGCQIDTALDRCDTDTSVQAPPIENTLTDARPLNPHPGYPDSPFRPPRA